MGGRGAMMLPLGSRVYKYEAVKTVNGIKVIEPKNKSVSYGMPEMSNTPNTRYILISKDGKSAMLRTYGADRLPVMEYAYDGHGSDKKYFHVHDWKDGRRDRPMTAKEIKKYGKLFYKAGLRR